MSCGVSHRHGSDQILLWLWHRLAATAPIIPLAWEPPYATGAALKIKKAAGGGEQSHNITHLCLMHLVLEPSWRRGAKAEDESSKVCHLPGFKAQLWHKLPDFCEASVFSAITQNNNNPYFKCKALCPGPKGEEMPKSLVHSENVDQVPTKGQTLFQDTGAQSYTHTNSPLQNLPLEGKDR